MIDLNEMLSSINVKRFSTSIHKCLKQFTLDDLNECKSQRFSDLSGNPYLFDLDIDRIYDVVFDWKTFNDDGYMWTYILRDRWDGSNIIDDSKILGEAYSMLIGSNFVNITKEEIRDSKIETIFE